MPPAFAVAPIVNPAPTALAEVVVPVPAKRSATPVRVEPSESAGVATTVVAVVLAWPAATGVIVVEPPLTATMTPDAG